MGKFDTVPPRVKKTEFLKSTHIKEYIKLPISLETRDSADPTVIGRSLELWMMPMDIHDADARITYYCSDFFYRPTAAGYGDFRDNNRKNKPLNCFCVRSI